MSKEKVEIELSANSAKLKSEFDAARARVERFTRGVRKSVTSLGALAVGALGVRQASQVFAELTTKFDRLGKIANRFNMPVEEVQRMEVAAKLSGTNVERMVAAMTKATVSGVEAGQGLATYTRAFEALGINIEAFNSAGPSEKIGMLAKALNEAKDEGQAFTAVYRILGKAGGDLIPLLRQNADGIANLTQGLSVLGAEDVKAIEKFNDDLVFLKSNMQANIGKKLAGDLKELTPAIVSAGEAVVDVTSFLLEHRKAIVLLIGGVVAYKAVKFGAAVTKDLIVLRRATVAMLAAKAATDAETAAVVRNTAAHAANSAARGAGGAGAAVKGAAGGRLIGELMGKAAAGRFGIGFLAKFSPHAIAAAVGFGIGKLAGDHLAGKMQESFEDSFKKANAPANDVLRTMHQMVTTAKTVEETTAAKEKITEQIARLEKENLGAISAQKKEANDHAIATAKIYLKSADTFRLRNQQVEVESKISDQYDFQLRQQAFANKLTVEGMAAAKKRAEAMEKAADAIRSSIASLKGEIVGEQIDLLPGAKRVEMFTASLKKGLKEAVGEFNLTSQAAGKPGGAGKESESMAGLYDLAKRAEGEGQIGLAESLYAKITALQKLQGEITKGKDEALKTDEEAKEKAKEQLDLALRRKQVGEEMEILRKKLSGDTAGAEAMREELELRREAKGLAEDLKITEDAALKMLRERAGLEKEISQKSAKKELGEELTILKLQASGQMKKAAALERELRLRREAAEIAERTGVSEKDALRIAMGRDKLRKQAEAVKGGDGDGGGEKGKTRIRLYNAKESLQRRLGRQSGGLGSNSNMNSMDRRNTDLGERFVREREASRSGPLKAVVQGDGAMPAKMDELIALEERMVKTFEKIVRV